MKYEKDKNLKNKERNVEKFIKREGGKILRFCFPGLK